jgi:hypothetical protein
MKNDLEVIESVHTQKICISKDVADFVDKYRQCITKTAKSILDLANVINDAKISLSADEFTQFRESIGADKRKESYIRKMLRIAENYARFENCLHVLPASYTTLYDLARMPSDQFSLVEPSLSPTLTAETIKKIVGASSTPAVKKRTSPVQHSNSKAFTIDASVLSEQPYQAFVNQLQSICAKYSLTLQPTVANSLN